MITLDNALTQGKADTGAGIFVRSVKSFEYAKDALLEFRLNADAVVADCKTPVVVEALRRYANDGRRRQAAVLDRVSYQVLEKLLKMCGMDRHGRQRTAIDLRAAL